MKNILITGIDGSAAQYLAEFLVGNTKLCIHGTSRKQYNHEIYKIHQCDLCDYFSVKSMLEASQPDYIFHLAANADVKMSFTNPYSVLNNNINNTLVLLETLRQIRMSPVFQMCSTSEVYGNVDTYPITEDYPLNPANIYAISKLTQEKLAKFYFDAYGLPVVITRAFGYINPRRQNIFSTAFAIQIANIEKGKQEAVIRHGNLDSIRTLLDVRDIAMYYWKASQECLKGIPYNIGSETPIKVRDILNKLVEMSDVKIELQQNQDLMRPNDVTLQIPSVERFKKLVNIEPAYSLNESLEYLLDYCRKHYVKK